MKNRGLLVVLGLILSLASSIQGQCTEDRYEPNNSFVQAVPSIVNASLSICTVGTNSGDWFGPYQLLVGQNLTIRIDFNQSEGNPDLIVTRFDASTVASSQSTTRPSEEVVVTGTMDLTQLWVNIILRTDAGFPGITYSYRVTYGPTPVCLDDPYEPNNNIQQAYPSATVAVACIANADYFGPINLAAGETLSAQISTQESQDALTVSLLSVTNQTIDNSVNVVGFSNLDYTSPTVQSVYLIVSYLSSSSGSPAIVYTVDWSISAPVCSDNDYLEPNSIVQLPKPLPGAAVNLVACLDSPDFLGPINLKQSDSFSVRISFSSVDRLDIRLSTTDGTALVPTTHSANSTQASLTYVHNQATPTGAVVEIYVISNPSTLGAKYDVYSSLSLTCVGVVCTDREECLNGQCYCLFGAPRNETDQLCPDPCEGVQCPSDEICQKGYCECITGTRNSAGVCVVDPCSGVNCPSGERCSNGACVCINGTRNSAGVCVVDPCSGVNCPSGERCSNGTCVCINGTRNSAGVCVVDPCSGVNCPSGERCSNGTCVCINGTRNSAGICVVDPCSGVVCPSNESCVQGVCQCLTGLIRNTSGVCVDACQAIKCGANEFCTNGTCFCNSGYTRATNGTCQPISNCTGVACPANSACQNGFCVCNSGFDNGSGGSSVNSTGTCRPIPCYNISCPAYSTCRENQCYCNNGYYNPQNGGAQTPTTGTCVQDKCYFIICPDNSNCQDGVCSCNQGFVKNSAGNCVLDPCLSVVCSDPVATCFNGVCFCPPGYDQRGETCVQLPPDACTLSNCAAKGALCRPETGECYCDVNFVLSPESGMCEYVNNNLCTFVMCPSNAYCHEGLCYCSTGYMERMGNCVPADLGGCSEYRGFTDEVTVELMNQVVLQNVNSQLSHLQSDLDWVIKYLPEWEQNECCPSTPYVYPFDMVEVAEASWAFLVDPVCSLDRYNEASQQYYQDLKY